MIVLGLGGMGSAALYHLARRGIRACGIEQFECAHARGSSHGQTRLIRRAYFEHPGYVPLVDAALAEWRALEAGSGDQLLRTTGLLLAGPADGVIVRGTLCAAREHALDVARVPRAEAARRWPGFNFADSDEILFEADAGVLRVEDCVRTHVSAAQRLGATTHFNCPVSGWRADAHGITVTAGGEQYVADRLVICGGPWTTRLLGNSPPELRVLRKTVVWYPQCTPTMHADNGCPAFGFDTPAGFCYGFPKLDACGVKVANHGGQSQVADPDEVDRVVSHAEKAEIDAFRQQRLPGVEAPAGDSSVCLYTMTPDEHFIIDRHPQYPNVIVACGFSGHGFKFAPVVGAHLADLATGGPAKHAVFRSLKPVLRAE